MLILLALAFALIGTARVRAIATDIEDMPAHPERVRPLDDPAADQAYGDIAEQLLDGGLADVAEDLGWMH
jgi:hypothetical protein